MNLAIAYFCGSFVLNSEFRDVSARRDCEFLR